MARRRKRCHRRVHLRLEEVGYSCARGHRLLRFGHFVEEQEVAMQLFVKLQYRCHIATPVAVVGCRPHCHKVLQRENERAHAQRERVSVLGT